MMRTTIPLVITCLIFLTAQAAVDSGRKTRTLNDALYLQSQTDRELVNRVQQKLRSTITNYNPGHYSIKVQNGVVTIIGKAPSAYVAVQLQDRTLQVEGVMAVQTNLTVEKR